MITAPFYVVAFGVFAAVLWRMGDRHAAAQIGVMVFALLLTWVAFAQSEWRHVWGCTIWLGVAAVMAVNVKSGRDAAVAILIAFDAMAFLLAYPLAMLGWPVTICTWIGNALMIAAAATAGGPTLLNGLDYSGWHARISAALHRGDHGDGVGAGRSAVLDGAAAGPEALARMSEAPPSAGG